MITLQKIGDAIKFTFSGNTHYLQDGTVEVPVNSLSLTIDDSGMATFRKSASNDIFISATYGELGMTKEELVAWYKENMVDGGGSDITSGDVQNMIDESISGKADSSAVTEEISAAVSGKQDTLIAGENITISGNVISSEGGNNVVELTQAEYDALVSGGTVDPTAFYIITDAVAFDPSTKVDTSAFTAYSAATNATLSGKQDTLSAGTGIEISGNVISATGGGGGKAIEAGRGIDITTGETADTISFILPISAGTGNYSIIEGIYTSAMSNQDHAEGYNTYANGNGYAAHAEGYQTSAMTYSCHAEGRGTKASGDVSHAEGRGTIASGDNSHAEGQNTRASGTDSHAEGAYTSASSVSNVSGINVYSGYQARHAEGCNTLANNASTHAEGYYTQANNFGEHASGVYNVSNSATTTYGDSGNTLFSVGNGTADNLRHNAFEIRQNGDIYCSDGTNDVKLQDTITATAANTTALGGLKLVKLTKSEYEGLVTKDNSTLYVVTDS